MSLVIYFINLAHRKDRLKHMLDLSKHMQMPFQRINAVHNPDNPAQGCTESRIKALEKFQATGEDRCLLLEDDFEPKCDPEFFAAALRVLPLSLPKEWDCVYLSHTATEPPGQIPSGSDLLVQLIDCLGGAACLIRKKFVQPLLEAHAKALLTGMPSDVAVRSILPFYQVYAPTGDVLLGKQMPSFSDIEKRFVDYEKEQVRAR